MAATGTIRINQWLALGRPRKGITPQFTSCLCDATQELAASPANREAWNQVCPGCRAQQELASGLPYIPSVGFAGAGMEAEAAAVGAVPIEYIPPPTIAPTSEQSGVAAAATPTGGAGPMTAYTTDPIFGGTFAGQTGLGFDVGGAVGTLAGCLAAGGDLLSCLGGAVGTGLGTGGDGTGYTGTTGLTASCPTGYEWDAGSQRCIESGLGGLAARIIPGGETGVLPSTNGGAASVVDEFGRAALVPMQVGSITRADGSTGPILRCRRGYVLARNDLCYPKGMAGLASIRKWKPAPRPVMSAQDARTLSKIDAIRRRARTAGKKAGLYVANRKPVCKTKKR